MKLLVIGDKARAEKYRPDLPVTREVEMVVVDRGTADEDILAIASDADFILADAISPVSKTLIENMPNLKLIHSEGVAYNAIDVDTARAQGIPVCNNAGVNAGAVAEHAVLLMLASLRRVVVGDREVRAARQIEMKETIMVEGARELGDCTIGFLGFGAIGQATALRLSTWGCKMLYNKRHPLDKADEERLNVAFATQDEIVATADIISLHVPVTEETREMVNREFLEKMRPDGILINTARGEIVDQEALVWALENDIIEGAGLDTLSPEPVQEDNPLLNLSPKAAEKVVFSPHIGGMSDGMFYRSYLGTWSNIDRVIKGEPLVNQV